MASDSEHFLMYLFATCIPLSEKCVFISDAHFLERVFEFGGLDVYILDISPLSERLLAKILSPSVGFLFTLLVISFEVQKRFNKMRSQLFVL